MLLREFDGGSTTIDTSTDNMEGKNDKEITSGDLLTFLQSFQKNMENKFVENSKIVEEQIEATNKKIDERLNRVDSEVEHVNKKIDENEDRNRMMNQRMEGRLGLLEKEMEKVNKNREWYEKLREKDRRLTMEGISAKLTDGNTDQTCPNKRTWGTALQEEWK